MPSKPSKAEALKDKTSRAINKLNQPVTLSTGGAVSKTSLGPTVTILHLPPGASNDERWNWFRILNVAATGEEQNNIRGTVTWVASLIYFCYEGVLKPLENVSYTPVMLSKARIDWNQSIMDFAKTMNSRPNEGNDLFTQKIRDEWPYEELPLPGPAKHASFSVTKDELEWYGYLSIVCFCIDKDLVNAGDNSVRNLRPTALGSKYGWTSQDVPGLLASLRPSTPMYVSLQQAWLRLGAIRMEFFLYACAIAEISASPADEVMFTTIRLMKYAAGSHIPIISAFLSAFEAAYEYPPLASYILVFSQGVTALREACPAKTTAAGKYLREADGEVARNLTYMPYIKLLYADKLDIAKRDPMLPLLYVAVNVLKSLDIHSTLSAYTVSATSNWSTLLSGFLEFKKQWDIDNANASDSDDDSDDDDIPALAAV